MSQLSQLRPQTFKVLLLLKSFKTLKAFFLVCKLGPINQLT